MRAWEEKAKIAQDAPAPQAEPAAQDTAKEEAPVKAATATKLTAHKLQHLETELAPVWWRKLPEIAAARPKQNGVVIVLNRLTGTNIAVWYIKRNENWNTASDMFLIKEHVIEDQQPQEETENEDTGTK